MLAENITDSEYLEVESSFTTDLLPHQHFFAFEGEDQFTFYVSAGELNNDELNLDLRLAGVSLDLDLDVQHLKILDGSSTGNSEIVDETYTIRNGELSVRFDQDYEVVQIVAPKNATLSTYEQTLLDKVEYSIQRLSSPNEIRGNDRGNSVLGTEFSDVIFGRAGDDALSGGGGRTNYFSDGLELDNNESSDFLFGGAGDDVLLGYDGSDVLHGGEGDDYLIGGGGADTFIFTKGDDTIEDFDYRLDQLKLSARFFDGNTNDLDRLISHEGEDLVINFEGDHSLTLLGVGQLTSVDLNLTTDADLIF
jgi:Ca2+-binding RTX toxin-like protein